MITVKQNKKLSKNFTLHEMWRRFEVAKKLGIDNSPSIEVAERLRRLAIDILQPIRDAYNDAILVKAYRCEELNKAIGGVQNSRHLTGDAADCVCHENADVLFRIAAGLDLPHHKCILEINKLGGTWLHISQARENEKPKQLFMIIDFRNGKKVNYLARENAQKYYVKDL